MSSKIRIGFVYSHPFQVHGAPRDESGRAILFPRERVRAFAALNKRSRTRDVDYSSLTRSTVRARFLLDCAVPRLDVVGQVRTAARFRLTTSLRSFRRSQIASAARPRRPVARGAGRRRRRRRRQRCAPTSTAPQPAICVVRYQQEEKE